jgi:hypothetical protein
MEIRMTEITRRSAATLIAAGAVALPAAGLLATSASAAPEPNMERALRALENAHAALQAARPNKGGHRERALGLVEQAINEVRNGIAYSGG